MTPWVALVSFSGVAAHPPPGAPRTPPLGWSRTPPPGAPRPPPPGAARPPLRPQGVGVKRCIFIGNSHTKLLWAGFLSPFFPQLFSRFFRGFFSHFWVRFLRPFGPGGVPLLGMATVPGRWSRAARPSRMRGETHLAFLGLGSAVTRCLKKIKKNKNEKIN